ncbi:uncharacterized protein LOC142974904 [Anticarsia gemmatalis]|uniref:uncharacterized protein LOC142974904 n=1 Tax=Anticarsia gemmatalis TaxID=129554 RepID=UPI003F7688DA
MLKHINKSALKTILRFAAKNCDGVLEYYRIVNVPESASVLEEFVDFQMNHFVKKELMHRLAGIPLSVRAMDEYRDILRYTSIKAPQYYSVMCCPEVNGEIVPKIVAASTVKLLTKSNWADDIQGKTTEVKRFYEISDKWNSLCPIPELMNKYGVDNIFDYQSVAVHHDYGRRGIASQVGLIRPDMCTAHNVGLCISWMTSEGTQKAAKKNGWITEFEVKPEEIAKLLNVTLNNPPPVYKFMVYKL